jgi:hypothetical protein
MRSAKRTKLRSLPTGPTNESPKGAPWRWAKGRLNCGKPAKPAPHSMRVARLR